ncbi:Holliday junction branch migration DNA helicase RuvB [Verrucomicrobia bacterium LW23]|nr:Holliday junction branch migration DNA helicase RuvB [Verrucomicrobia bacterium LW23]
MPAGSGSEEAIHLAEKPDPAFEHSLRPVQLDEFVGQPKIKERLEVVIGAARTRGEALEHMLFCGPPGLGKTSLAHIVARAMDAQIKCTSGPVLEKAGDLAGLLTSLGAGDVLFIDEIHRLNKVIEEYLYPAMEDYKLDIIIDQGPNARSIRLPLPKFTLIGATTRAGMLSSPMRSRFGMLNRLDYYRPEDLQRVILRSAGLMGLEMDAEAALEIGRRARGTPRIANNLVRFVRDYALMRAPGERISQPIADAALRMFEIDEDGLDEMDMSLLRALILKFNGGPVGLNSLAVAIGEEPGTLEEVHEPFLIMGGYVKRTAQGRVAMQLAYDKLGLQPKPRQIELFE